MSRAPNPKRKGENETKPRHLKFDIDGFLKFGIAILTTSGAIYLLGYVAQVNIRLFTFFDIRDFINASITYLPVTLMFIAASSPRFLLKERDDEPLSLTFLLWKDKNKEWSESFDKWFRRSFGFFFLVMAMMYLGVFRFGFHMNAFLSLVLLGVSLILINELYAYANARYRWFVDNWSFVMFTVYYLVTSFAIGYMHSSAQQGLQYYSLLVQMSTGQPVCTSVVQRMGERILVDDIEHGSWRVLEASKVEEIIQLRPSRLLLNSSCSEAAESLPSWGLKSVVLDDRAPTKSVEPYASGNAPTLSQSPSLNVDELNTDSENSPPEFEDEPEN